MRVLYHHRTRAGDAQGIHIAEMQRALRGRGHALREVALVDSGAPATAAGGAPRARAAAAASWLAGRGPRWWRELGELAYNLVAYPRLVRAARAFGADVLYERYAAFTVAGAWAARRCGIPLLLEVNSPLARERREHGGLTLARLAARSERYLCRRAARTLVVSAALGRMLIAEGAPPQRVSVLPNGVRRGFAERGNRAAARARWSIPGDATVVGVIGWFRPWHGLERLLEAAAADWWRAAGVRLVLAGDGPGLAAVAAAAAALGEAVILAGPVPREDLEDVLAAFDIAVQPAVTPYACPMKILEYMAAGCAIVAPGSENVRELLTHRRNALLCGEGPQPGAAQLAAAVRELAEDPGLRLRLGENARATLCERKYYWEENVRRIEELVAGGGEDRQPASWHEEARPC